MTLKNFFCCCKIVINNLKLKFFNEVFMYKVQLSVFYYFCKCYLWLNFCWFVCSFFVVRFVWRKLFVCKYWPAKNNSTISTKYARPHKEFFKLLRLFPKRTKCLFCFHSSFFLFSNFFFVTSSLSNWMSFNIYRWLLGAGGFISISLHMNETTEEKKFNPFDLIMWWPFHHSITENKIEQAFVYGWPSVHVLVPCSPSSSSSFFLLLAYFIIWFTKCSVGYRIYNTNKKLL